MKGDLHPGPFTTLMLYTASYAQADMDACAEEVCSNSCDTVYFAKLLVTKLTTPWHSHIKSELPVKVNDQEWSIVYKADQTTWSFLYYKQ